MLIDYYFFGSKFNFDWENFFQNKFESYQYYLILFLDMITQMCRIKLYFYNAPMF